MKKKKYKTKNKTGIVSEPESGYEKGDKKIKFFSSLRDMEEDNYKWLATLSAEQHLQNATALIKRLFAEDLKRNPHLGNKIFFD